MMVMQTENVQTDMQPPMHCQNDDNCDAKERGAFHAPLFSREWEWEECCYYAIE